MNNNEDSESITLEEFRSQLVTCLNCFCGLCVYRCPAYVEMKNEAVTTRGLSQICLAVLDGELQLSELPDELVYACTGCHWCEWTCSLNTPPYIQRFGTRKTKVSGTTMTEILRSMKVESGEVPGVVKEALDNMVHVGNPYGKSRGIKDSWVEGLGHKFDGKESLLYVGSMVPYEPRATQMAEALVKILETAGVEFSMLGADELDSGALARYMGEEGLFTDLAEQNSKQLRQKGIKRIICLSPHDYDTFRSCYGLEDIDIKHYTEVIRELIKDGRIEFKNRVNKKVTYQDPCYLGRKYDIYGFPREILLNIPGLQLVEMDLTKGEASCCGGGGTGLWYDLPRININCTRIEQAKDKAVHYLVVACPACFQLLDDGAKSLNCDLVVRDVAQIVMEAL